MMKHKIIKILAILIITMVCAISPLGVSAYASTSSFDNTYVLDDLESMTIDGAKFNLNDYHKDGSDNMQMIQFVEYGYSYDTQLNTNFGLYIYIFNPSSKPFSKGSRNTIQISVEKDKDNKPINYKKYTLEFVNTIEQGSLYMFYKFKVKNSQDILKNISGDIRSYNISGFELIAIGDSKPKEHKVARTYNFKGYGLGLGQDKTKSTLEINYTNLDVIELDINHTYYRTGISDKGMNYRDQINTAFFMVDSKWFKDGYKLNEILTTWHEYTTQPIVVTDKQNVFDGLTAQIGEKQIPGPVGTVPPGKTYLWTEDNSWIYGVLSDFYKSSTDTIYNVFYTGGTPAKNYTLDSNTLEEYFKSYNKTANKGLLFNGYSADLFDEADNNRITGKQTKKISADDTFDLKEMDWNNLSWAEKWLKYLGKKPVTTGNKLGISPIHIVEASDMIGTYEQIAEKLLIDINKIDEMKLLLLNNPTQKLVLFRYAVTDYFSANVITHYTVDVGLAKRDGYVAKQTVFFDYDIIQLTFKSGTKTLVVPVAANPIDIIADVTPPLDFENINIIIVAISILVSFFGAKIAGDTVSFFMY